MRKRILLTLTLFCAMPVMHMLADDCCTPCCTTNDDCSDVCCDVDCSDCKCDTFSRTFFTVRPQYQTASPEKVSLFRDRTYAREDGKGGAFQMTFFGGRSTNAGGMRSYFFPKCKNWLTAKEELDTEQTYGPTGNADLHPIHFRVVSQNFVSSNVYTGESEPVYPPLTEPFESSITMCPRQTTFGIGLTYRQDLTTLMNPDEADDKDYHWWFEISSPLTRVKNDLRLNEKFERTMEEAGGVADVTTITGLDEDHIFYSTMKEAFNQPAWKYGKICGSQTKWRLADIEAKLGWEWHREDTCRLEGYVGLLIPTGNRPTACYLFEPIVGHNKHFGIIKGGSACFKIWEDEEEGKTVKYAMDIHGMYLFKKCEKRSFDLKGKPWSRYMEVYANQADAQKAYDMHNTDDNKVASFLYSTPGINVFTQDMLVRPRLSCNTTTALIYDKEETGFRAEVGYNCYCRQKECVELSCPWAEEAALKAYGGIGTTSVFRKIDFDASYSPTLGAGNQIIDRSLAEYEHSIIKAEDLDLDSAAHPAAFSHTFYLALGKRWEDRDYPLFLGAGLSYEYGSDNTAMSRFLGWVKWGVSF